MTIVHATTFSKEALDKVEAAAKAATAVEGVVGYRILGGQDTVTLLLEVADHATFDRIAEHAEARKASEALWETDPPKSHEFLHVLS
ncbi:MAG: hypothetical protein L0H79_21525 [Intrasporangium sp.]|uniref:hypothetical protein n=1 Tax=Intrasporangium sp. TaxID=1925024 RepID=UPI002648170A|nr:hypothetical protein [Intrasporangium sp.]MDN5798309.1 hypothetical protein [Intrasporangium sp.]